MQLVDIRDDIRQVIADKGVDMTGTIPLSEYPGKIAEISTREYPGYKVKKGEIGKLSQSNNQTLSGIIPDGIIPLTLKLTHTNTNSELACLFRLI